MEKTKEETQAMELQMTEKEALRSAEAGAEKAGETSFSLIRRFGERSKKKRDEVLKQVQK